MSLNIVLQNDLKRIVERLAKEADFFRGKSILITGGTGFFGKWLVLALDEFNKAHKLELKISILSRNPERLLAELPHLTNITLCRGDVLNLPDLPRHDLVIHAATTASDVATSKSPTLQFDTTYQGTRNLVEWALKTKVEGFLLTSSGAIYGRQPEAISHLSEDFAGGPIVTNPKSDYAEGKRASEHIGVLLCKETQTRFLIARCFAFVGPWLPLDTHFAVGNFLLNGAKKEDFIIKGDGTTRRSYMYTEDLVVWLLTILARGKSLTAYNVGSDHSVSIRETAEAARTAWKSKNEIKVLTPIKDPTKFEQYVPAISKAEHELGLRNEVDFAEALKRTATWIEQTGFNHQ